MWECKPITVPMNDDLSSPSKDYHATDSIQISYLSAFGLLMYAILGTRLDLAFLISVVSQYVSNPNPGYWQAMKRIFCYICGTFLIQLTYRRTLSNLQRYTDIYWAGDCNTCQSTFGYIFNVGSGDNQLIIKTIAYFDSIQL